MAAQAGWLLWGVGFLVLATSGWRGAPAAAADITSKGATTCEGMRVAVRFTYDPGTSVIRNLTVTHTCSIEAQGAFPWEPQVTIPVRPDGSFHYADRYGTAITGTVLRDGVAAGELKNTPQLFFFCGGTPRSPCMKWTTAPE